MARDVRAVSRALDMMELFLDGRRDMSAAELSDALALPRTTVHELLVTLTARGYLVAVGRPRRYELGRRAFELGSAYAGDRALAREGRRVAQAIMERCRETVQVAVLDGTDVVYVVKVDSPHSVRMVSGVGRRLPAHVTAGGKVMLSALGPEALRARYPASGRLAVFTPESLATVKQLEAELALTRERGTGRDRCESNAEVRCVAAPVRGAGGAVIAAVSISVPVSRWTALREDELDELVREAATDIEIGVEGGQIDSR